jgi:hypothetical protein
MGAMMERLPGYDQWLLPPDPVFYDTACDTCDREFSHRDEYIDGDECPECESGHLYEQEPPDPCLCSGHTCYC